MKPYPILFAFILLLFIGCGPNAPAIQPAIDNGEQATVNGEQITDNEEWTTVNGKQTTDNGQRITDNGQRITDNGHPAPTRDPVALAQAYRGVGDIPQATPGPMRTPAVGERRTFSVLNVDEIIFGTIEAELLAVSEYAYYWFEVSRNLNWPNERSLRETAVAFDEAYTQVVALFGEPAQLQTAADPRLHILNAAPISLCGVDPCGLLGYYSPDDALPLIVEPNSNEREMFVMNGRYFGDPGFISTLIHELRHLVEAGYDKSDADWAVEGSAVLAEDLLGYSAGPINRANQFLRNPDQQLNSWTEYDSGPYYGQGYLLNRYIYNRFGTDLYREFATHPASGLAAVTAVAAAHNLGYDGHDLWRDWQIALAIHNRPGAPEVYWLREGIDAATMTSISRVPFNLDTTVSQYAADYYQLAVPDGSQLTFNGASQTPLLPVKPVSGDLMWAANRANYSQAQLTRAFDLRGATSATLHYDVFHDIERGYDFAYVSASADGGRSWQPLVAPNMQGLSPDDDPSGTAYADRFYTSSSKGWVKEQIDLTPFAGQEILLRFEYVTDPILTFHGLALDNIRIPEIGFVDGAEEEQGWTADGFFRTNGWLAQGWEVWLVEEENGRFTITPLLPDTDGTIRHTLRRLPGDTPPILIIAAHAPQTLNPAHYRLTVE
jgi:immune inhibitor A